jgi:hypothetical protein
MGRSRITRPGRALTEKQDRFVRLIAQGVPNAEACRIVGPSPRRSRSGRGRPRQADPRRSRWPARSRTRGSADCGHTNTATTAASTSYSATWRPGTASIPDRSRPATAVGTPAGGHGAGPLPQRRRRARMPVSGDPRTRPHRARSGTIDATVVARHQRVLHHLRRPLPGSRNLLTGTAANTVHAIDPRPANEQ